MAERETTIIKINDNFVFKAKLHLGNQETVDQFTAKRGALLLQPISFGFDILSVV